MRHVPRRLATTLPAVERLVVHRPGATSPLTRVVAPGVQAMALDAFVARINA